VRELSAHFRPYEWAISTAEAARLAGVRPEDVLRFDANTAPGPPAAARPAAVSQALARVQAYPHGGYPELVDAIAQYAGVDPENVVLGAGADDLILLAARTFAGPGDGVVVIRTLSKAFALAGARVGYALAEPETARELNARQAPAPISTLSAAVALAVLAEPPDVAPLLEERERLALSLRELGLEPLPSAANFLYVPVERARELGERLLGAGLVVRAYPEAIRVTVLDRPSNERLGAALDGFLATS
jgi:histidinol-phosphate/aromatic aminotransferase/cobyric acid decarboxylase-like protein